MILVWMVVIYTNFLSLLHSSHSRPTDLLSPNQDLFSMLISESIKSSCTYFIKHPCWEHSFFSIGSTFAICNLRKRGGGGGGGGVGVGVGVSVLFWNDILYCSPHNLILVEYKPNFSAIWVLKVVHGISVLQSHKHHTNISIYLPGLPVSLCIFMSFGTFFYCQYLFETTWFSYFSLRCLGPWMNHLLPAWWYIFRFVFLRDSCCERYSGEEYCMEFLLLFMFLYITQVLPIIFPLKYFSLWNNCLY